MRLHELGFFFRVERSVRSGSLTEGREAIEQVEDQSHHVDRHHDEDPECVTKRLQERHQRRRFRLLSRSIKHFNG